MDRVARRLHRGQDTLVARALAHGTTAFITIAIAQ